MTLTSLRDSLKAWWPVVGIAAAVCSVIVLWGGLPARVAKAEEQIDDLKAWSKELMGYTRAQQEMNRQQQQQSRPQVQEWQDAEGRWWCCNPDQDDCERNDAWYRC